jgi:hypothetical protein
MYNRVPKADSQCGRIISLFLSAHACADPLHCEDDRCGKVPLPRVLALRVSQYSSRVWDLRNRFGFLIQNGHEQDDASRTWFRLSGRHLPTPDVLEDKHIQAAMRTELETGKPSYGLFPPQELERCTAGWRDDG